MNKIFLSVIAIFILVAAWFYWDSVRDLDKRTCESRNGTLEGGFIHYKCVLPGVPVTQEDLSSIPIPATITPAEGTTPEK